MTRSTHVIPGGIDGYDAARLAGWTYHRNGVSGCDFYAKVEDDALRVAWSVMDDDDLEAEPTYPVAASVPLPVLAGIARLDAIGPSFDRQVRRSPATLRHVIATNDSTPALRAFDMDPGDPDDISGRILVVSDIHAVLTKSRGVLSVESVGRVAAFLLSEILAGDASTTLRGDTPYDDAVAVERLAIGLGR